MSRESGASLSVVPVAAIQRLGSPACLSVEESAIWEATVNSKPADWFQDDSAPLLTEYVRAVVKSSELDRVIKSMTEDGEGWKEKAKPIIDFMKLRDMEAKRAVSIATKLRLTQQSRYTPLSAATANKKAGAARPWLHANNAK